MNYNTVTWSDVHS